MLRRALRSPASARTGAAVDVSDELLVAQSRDGDDVALATLLGRYRGFARAKARSYFLVGGEHEDVVQEGMIGLYKAVRDFDPSHHVSFRTFAEMCVTRQMISAVKAANRHKHGPLNTYVSFSRPVASDDDDDRELGDVLPSRGSNDPADIIISAERIRALQAHVQAVLSDLEVEVLRLYVEGKSYVEIAELTARHTKAVDNALQRVKRKLESHLHSRSASERG